MTSEKTICRTKIIEDLPAEDDLLFSGGKGPHKRVADAISEMIQAEPGGKMIGLEGAWGSGKSTVTKIVKNNLKQQANFSLFYFDAWAHEGDPLRRTFLESLIRSFQEAKWVDQKHWNTILESLANRRKTTQTRTTPKTTFLGKAFAIALLLTPVGIPFLVAALREDLTVNLYYPISWTFLFGFSLTISPIAVLVVNALRLLWLRIKKKPYDTGENWSFLNGHAITEVKLDSIETTNPTSIEFEDIFRQLMTEGLDGDKSKKCLMVLDNLDRVDAKYALSIWSTLQTFLQDRSTRNETWFKHLWLLIPYDPRGLTQLWSKSEEEKTEVPKNNVAKSFLDKSFQVRFEVTPLVLSNWKSYLINLLKEALPDHSTDDDLLNKIFSVYNVSRLGLTESPTPRELKIFVNQIGSIHRQWEHEFPLSHVAYYVILKRQTSDIAEHLIKGNIPIKAIESLVESDLKANLAGLIFNVKNTVGQQLLLKDPITKALASSKPESIQEFKNNHGQGFWAVLDQILLSDLPEFDLATFANTCTCLKESKILDDGPEFSIKSAKDNLGKAALRKDRWQTFDKNIMNGIDAICNIIAKREFSLELIGNVRQSLSSIELQNFLPSISEGLLKVCRSCDELGHIESLSGPFTLPVNETDWIKECSFISNADPKYWKLFKPKASFKQVEDQLATNITSGEYSEDLVTAIKVTNIAFKEEAKWDDLILAVAERLNYSQKPTSPEIGNLLKLLYLLQDLPNDSQSEGLQTLVESGKVLSALYQVESQGSGHIESKAMCIMAFLDFKPDGSNTSSVGYSSSGFTILTNTLASAEEGLATAFTNLILTHNKISILFNVVNARGYDDPFIIKVLKNLVDNKSLEQLMSVEIFVPQWKEFNDHLNDSEKPKRFEELVNGLCERKSLAAELVKKTFDINNGLLYTFVFEASNDDVLKKWCKRELENLSTDEWKVQLQDEGPALTLLATLVKSTGTAIKLKTKFEDAILWHAKEVMHGTISISSQAKGLWSDIINGLDGPQRKMLPQRLLSEIMEVDGNIANDFFEIYREEISQDVENQANIVEKVFSPIVLKDNVSGLIWLKNLFTANPNFFDIIKNKSSEITYFKDRIANDIAEQSKNQTPAFKIKTEIATVLGINPKGDK